MFSDEQIRVIRFCAEECARQESGELSVHRMVCAYNFAVDLESPTHVMVCTIAAIIDPNVNSWGIRKTPVCIGPTVILAPNPDTFEKLCNAWDDLTPIEWYTEFEKMHPFRDGNGRAGAILYNLRNNTMDNPVTPPDVFEG